MLAAIAMLVLSVAGCTTGAGSSAVTASQSGGNRAALCARIDAALAHTRDARRLDASVHGAWQVV
ncbi:MAG TPA: hypothetical protein DC048_10935, partial [Planctomycetaceae bacterium]|nr:hypothetical protein [Planctomycetaceae bacterium]